MKHSNKWKAAPTCAICSNNLIVAADTVTTDKEIIIVSNFVRCNHCGHAGFFWYG